MQGSGNRPVSRQELGLESWPTQHRRGPGKTEALNAQGLAPQGTRRGPGTAETPTETAARDVPGREGPGGGTPWNPGLTREQMVTENLVSSKVCEPVPIRTVFYTDKLRACSRLPLKTALLLVCVLTSEEARKGKHPWVYAQQEKTQPVASPRQRSGPEGRALAQGHMVPGLRGGTTVPRSSSCRPAVEGEQGLWGHVRPPPPPRPRWCSPQATLGPWMPGSPSTGP